jgi:hypothetical protein
MAEIGQGRTLTRVEITAIAWAMNIFSGIINTIGTKAIGHMSMFNVWWTLGGMFVLTITLLVKSPVKVKFSQFVWRTFYRRNLILHDRILLTLCLRIFKSKLLLTLQRTKLVTGGLASPVGSREVLSCFLGFFRSGSIMYAWRTM